MQRNECKNYHSQIKVTKFNLKSNQDIVLRLIDCYPDSPIYEEMQQEYNEIEPLASSLIEPVAIIEFGELKDSVSTTDYKKGTPSCYVFMSIGDKVKKLSQKYFEEGNYLAGMLVNAIADDYLFRLDNELQVHIKKACHERHVGVIKRLGIPNDIPMYAQKVILEETGANRDLGIGVTEGYMYTTVKSNGYILILSETDKRMNIEHDCSNCSFVDCKMRDLYQANTQLQLVYEDKKTTISCRKNESILAAMIRQDVYMSAACGGRGTCGKCKIKIVDGNLGITQQDEKIFSKEELAAGYRLACKAYPKKNCTISIITSDESDFEIITNNTIKHGELSELHDESYGMAVDIGTTTIAVSLVGLTSRKVIHTYTTINKQRAYGSDVISRIQASNNGKKEELRYSICKDLLECFRHIIEEVGIQKEGVTQILIAGNTTMGHLLMGYSCDGLGIYPFTPVNIGIIERQFKEVFNAGYLKAKVTLLSGISAYVGADITAGLLTCDFDKKTKPCILVDLGTNGEMVIGKKDSILVTSTAVGPAFEGGNISHGVGSIAGAICNVSIINDEADESETCQPPFRLEYKTIGNKSPVGICGTGVIEITSELLSNKFVDETGLLDEEYFEDGFPIADGVTLTQKDIREIQLAKAAVRAGLETLLIRYGVTYNQIGTVYLAGGFGYKINVDKAIHIGLLPEELKGKIKAIGNSSLAGAVQFLIEEDMKERMEKIVSISQEVRLSNDKDFNNLYVNHMCFSNDI